MKPCILKILSLLMILFCYSCQDDDNYSNLPDGSALESRLVQLYGSKAPLRLPSATDYASIPSDPNNPITAAKVSLGRLLFHETLLGSAAVNSDGMYSYSCASCHHVAAGFQSGMQQGIGEGGSGFGILGESRVKNPLYAENELDIQPIRTPSALNSAFQQVMLWNGQFGAVGPNQGTEAQWTVGTPKEVNLEGFEGVETQAIAGLGVHRLEILENEIINSPYKAMFDEAFPLSVEEERYSKINAALAIAAYERTLLPTEAPFQKWLNGANSAMTQNQLDGAELFFGKAGCYSCHAGPALNDDEFHALGMLDLSGPNIVTVVDEATEKGRGGFTGNSSDDYKFKTPQLYNLKNLQFFGHGGTFSSIKEVIQYKNNANPDHPNVPSHQLSSLFIPLNLSDQEIDLIAEFIEEALYDDNLLRYVPENLPSGNCFPNADPQSSIDLGCN